MELHDSHRRSAENTKPTPIAVGDIVVVHDEERPRGFRRLARVDYRNRRSGSRCVHKIKVGKLTRPIQLLYPLEIRSENERIAVDSHESATVEVHRRSTQSRRNPRRAAAIESEKRRPAID